MFRISSAAALAFAAAGAVAMAADPWEQKRSEMVRLQIEARGVIDPAVRNAMRKVPRHLFVPEALRAQAYEDTPLPIGHGQTISQPYLVARMTELLEVGANHKVLEIGTGSGYQAAILAELCENVFTIEIVPELSRRAQRTLADLGYRNIEFRIGDGYNGWKEKAPFDRILLTAAPEEVPEPLKEQLKEGGVLVAPVGPEDGQKLVRLRRKKAADAAAAWEREELESVRFVPLVRAPEGSSEPASSTAPAVSTQPAPALLTAIVKKFSLDETEVRRFHARGLGFTELIQVSLIARDARKKVSWKEVADRRVRAIPFSSLCERYGLNSEKVWREAAEIRRELERQAGQEEGRAGKKERKKQ